MLRDRSHNAGIVDDYPSGHALNVQYNSLGLFDAHIVAKLDENYKPKTFKCERELADHTVFMVQEKGWSGMKKTSLMFG